MDEDCKMCPNCGLALLDLRTDVAGIEYWECNLCGYEEETTQ